MNLSASVAASPGSLSASLGAGYVTLNGYVIGLSEIPGGHRLTVSRGNEAQFIDIMDGERGPAGNGIASAALSADFTLTLTFTDGTNYTTPSLRGEAGAGAWAEITGKPAFFPPESHVHAQDDVTGLTAALGALGNSLDALEGAALSRSAQTAAYHLGFYIDEDGDLCQAEEAENG